MAIFDAAKEIINNIKEAKSIEAAQIHIGYLQEKLADVEKKVASLESENADILRENIELKKQLESIKKDEQYLDLGMCLIKKNPQGGYFDTPLCTKCKNPLSHADFAGKSFCDPCKVFLESTTVNAAVKKAITS